MAVRAEPRSEVQTTGVEGARYPVAEGSSGAALLFGRPEREALALLKSASKPQTDAKFLRAAFADLRAKGWCRRRQVACWPVAALSAPIRDSGGAIVASLSFIVPESRADDASLPQLLLKTAASIQH